MGIEIERKFLLKNDNWRPLGIPVSYSQGYLVADAERTVRIRVEGSEGFVTIKGRLQGISRLEFEYQIPAEEALEMLQLSIIPLIEKSRTKILYEGKVWEVDEFKGDNEGLIMAEIELKSEDEPFSIPPWIGQEVSGDLRYFNSSLAQNPFNKW